MTLDSLNSLNRWDGGLAFFLATGKLDIDFIHLHVQFSFLHLPVTLAWIVSMFVMSGLITALVSVNVMILVWLERKVSGLIQSRMGPMMVGVVKPRGWATRHHSFRKWASVWFGGWLQTLADGIKLLLKEDIIPAKADKWVFISAPVLVFTASLMSYAVLPFTPNFPVLKDLNIGFLFIFAVGSYSSIGILMAGWSSNNKYSLLGGMRSAAQMISYEIPLVLSLIGVVMMAGSLRMEDLVNSQRTMGGHHGHWFILYQPIAFLIFLISSVAETNRPPFDMPEAESELVSGFNTEYSGFRFSVFFLSEFANMFLACGLAAAVFLGGWAGPGSENAFVAFFWFIAKTYLMVLLFMWIRWTFPRLRVDQLMEFGWKVLTPAAIINILWTGIEIALVKAHGYHHQYLYIWVPILLFMLLALLLPRPKGRTTTYSS